MLGKLVKFIILTRINKSALGITIFFLFLESLYVYIVPATFSFYYVTSFFAFTILVYAITSGLLLTKSDAYYLLTLPLDRSQISLALFLGNFVVSGYFSLFFGIFTLKILGLLGILVTFAFSLIAVSISIILANSKIAYRALVGGLLALWYVSPFFHFYYSPTAIFLGLNYNYAFLLLLLLFSIYFAIQNLNNIRFKVFTQSGQNNVKRIIEFSGKSPFLAILTRSFSFFEISTRINYMGNTSFRSIRINIYYILIATTIIAISYFIATIFIPLYQLIIFIPILEIMFLYYASFSSFSFEPLWLTMGLMEPVRYARYYLLSKALSIVLIFLPISIVFLLNPITLSLGISTLLVLPFSYIYLSSIQAILNPFQVKDENVMPNYRYTAIQYLVLLLSSPALILIYVPALVPGLLSGVISGLISIVLAIPFLFSSRFWLKVEEKMVVNGFV
ncbi:hypothetical protein DFR86_01585 [Acidianus sulfidivorans JP7]|uniref:Uncharacterized protein n=1 Tax=Acidianus sulfidivorans JP7 TaxID=619593 RepID=A0A2U9IJZ8_9CREN|nr:hypothetical protein [Acidianus sulfidivorans]AWR96367.1 hypothetical protein DFR86_01585 [Acidianus sulfidivorans JP7]